MTDHHPHHHHHDLEKRAMASFRSLSHTNKKLHPENFKHWSALELAEFLKSCGLGDYSEMVVQHGITGAVAPRMTEHDLKEMGVTLIGDRKRFTAAIETVQKAARKMEREKTIWEGDQVLWTSWWEGCRGTCCGCCPVDPAHYKLTGTHLQIKTEQIRRFGPIRCCCGHEYEVDNVDLTFVKEYVEFICYDHDVFYFG
jgi:SAM domain (Sterile alpha motif)